MTSVPWPDIFPDLFEISGASFTPVANSMAIDTESGEPMTRRRFTGEMDDFSGNLPAVTAEIAAAIVDFYRYDLKDGSLPILWNHPLTKEAVEFLFMTHDGESAPPSFTPLPGGYWKPAFNLRRLP